MSEPARLFTAMHPREQGERTSLFFKGRRLGAAAGLSALKRRRTREKCLRYVDKINEARSAPVDTRSGDGRDPARRQKGSAIR